jgi:hypothetical protein
VKWVRGDEICHLNGVLPRRSPVITRAAGEVEAEWRHLEVPDRPVSDSTVDLRGFPRGFLRGFLPCHVSVLASESWVRTVMERF